MLSYFPDASVHFLSSKRNPSDWISTEFEQNLDIENAYNDLVSHLFQARKVRPTEGGAPGGLRRRVGAKGAAGEAAVQVVQVVPRQPRQGVPLPQTGE